MELDQNQKGIVVLVVLDNRARDNALRVFEQVPLVSKVFTHEATRDLKLWEKWAVRDEQKWKWNEHFINLHKASQSFIHFHILHNKSSIQPGPDAITPSRRGNQSSASAPQLHRHPGPCDSNFQWLSVCVGFMNLTSWSWLNVGVVLKDYHPFPLAPGGIVIWECLKIFGSGILYVECGWARVQEEVHRTSSSASILIHWSVCMFSQDFPKHSNLPSLDLIDLMTIMCYWMKAKLCKAKPAWPGQLMTEYNIHTIVNS